jgi:HSP20 family molecular chaperone IbpA
MSRLYTIFTPLLTFFSSMDFIDDPAESTVTAVFEIPGVKTSDISLHILDGHLVVSGERRPTYNTPQQSEAPTQDSAESGTQASKLTIPIQELRFGTFRRAVQIPEGLKVRHCIFILNPPPTSLI